MKDYIKTIINKNASDINAEKKKRERMYNFAKKKQRAFRNWMWIIGIFCLWCFCNVFFGLCMNGYHFISSLLIYYWYLGTAVFLWIIIIVLMFGKEKWNEYVKVVEHIEERYKDWK